LKVSEGRRYADLRIGATTYYGFKAQTRIMGMEIRRWRDEVEQSRWGKFFEGGRL